MVYQPSRTPATHLNKDELLKALNGLHHVFARASIGDFSHDVYIPEEESELTDLFVGVQVIIEAIREKITALETANTALEHQVWEKTSLIRELKERKKNVEQDKAKTEAVLDSIGEGIIAADQTGKIILVNAAATRLLGFSARGLLGQPLLKKVILKDEYGRDIPEAEHPHRQVLKTRKKIATTHGHFVCADRHLLPIVLTATPIMAGSTLLGTIAVFRDVTREKEIDRTKSEFVSLASHQLRTPLTAINWYVERLRQGRLGKLKPKQQVYLNEIAYGSKRMAELVGALLNVSRIELGTFAIAPRPTHVKEVVDEILQDFKTDIEEKGMKIKIVYHKGIPMLNVDPSLLRLIIENLLDNAIKYTPARGTITLDLDCANSRAKKESPLLCRNLAIAISDTGYGIPRRQRHNIFKKLFRAENIKTLDTDGTGLGLYIVKSIVDYCGGTIRFTSQEKKGTTFRVVLPLTESVTQAVVTK
jgi:PAS domain S-box-containing protein